TKLEVLRAENEIRAARIESIIDYARTARDIDTYHDIEQARENLLHRIAPESAGPVTARQVAETLAHPDTPAARRSQQIDDLIGYAKELAALDPAAVDTATARLLRRLDALVGTVQLRTVDQVGETIR